MATKTKTTTHTKASAGTKVTAHDPADLNALILGCFEDIEKNKFSLNQFIYEMYEEEKYKPLGYEKFSDYVEKELPCEYRIAMWYRQMGKVQNLFNISQDVVDSVGWTKFKELAALITDKTNPSDVQKMLDYAAAHTFIEVQQYVKKKRAAQHGKEIVEKKTVSFTWTVPQYEIIQGALSEAMALANTENESLAFEYICGEWMLNHAEGGNPEVKESLHVPPTAVESRMPQVERADKGKKKTPAKKAAKKASKKNGKPRK